MSGHPGNGVLFSSREAFSTVPSRSKLHEQHYTHVVRDLLDADINVLAQLVGKMERKGDTHYSLSCNLDLTLDLVPRVREAKRQGANIALLAQVNSNLPFMYGDASVAPTYFDGIVDDSKYDFALFGPPDRPVSTAEYMIALHVSALIRDGGTLQIWIGALEDAVTYLLGLRHQQPGRTLLQTFYLFQRVSNRER